MQEGYGGDSDDGIIARSVAYLFEQLAARGVADGCRYELRCSFAEIYNEQARSALVAWLNGGRVVGAGLAAPWRRAGGHRSAAPSLLHFPAGV